MNRMKGRRIWAFLLSLLMVFTMAGSNTLSVFATAPDDTVSAPTGGQEEIVETTEETSEEDEEDGEETESSQGTSEEASEEGEDTDSEEVSEEVSEDSSEESSEEVSEEASEETTEEEVLEIEEERTGANATGNFMLKVGDADTQAYDTFPDLSAALAAVDDGSKDVTVTLNKPLANPSVSTSAKPDYSDRTEYYQCELPQAAKSLTIEVAESWLTKRILENWNVPKDDKLDKFRVVTKGATATYPITVKDNVWLYLDQKDNNNLATPYTLSELNIINASVYVLTPYTIDKLYIEGEAYRNFGIVHEYGPDDEELEELTIGGQKDDVACTNHSLFVATDKLTVGDWEFKSNELESGRVTGKSSVSLHFMPLENGASPRMKVTGTVTADASAIMWMIFSDSEEHQLNGTLLEITDTTNWNSFIAREDAFYEDTIWNPKFKLVYDNNGNYTICRTFISINEIEFDNEGNPTENFIGIKNSWDEVLEWFENNGNKNKDYRITCMTNTEITALPSKEKARTITLRGFDEETECRCDLFVNGINVNIEQTMPVIIEDTNIYYNGDTEEPQTWTVKDTELIFHGFCDMSHNLVGSGNAVLTVDNAVLHSQSITEFKDISIICKGDFDASRIVLNRWCELKMNHEGTFRIANSTLDMMADTTVELGNIDIPSYDKDWHLSYEDDFTPDSFKDNEYIPGAWAAFNYCYDTDVEAPNAKMPALTIYGTIDIHEMSQNGIACSRLKGFKKTNDDGEIFIDYCDNEGREFSLEWDKGTEVLTALDDSVGIESFKVYQWIASEIEGEEEAENVYQIMKTEDGKKIVVGDKIRFQVDVWGEEVPGTPTKYYDTWAEVVKYINDNVKEDEAYKKGNYYVTISVAESIGAFIMPKKGNYKSLTIRSSAPGSKITFTGNVAMTGNLYLDDNTRLNPVKGAKGKEQPATCTITLDTFDFGCHVWHDNITSIKGKGNVDIEFGMAPEYEWQSNQKTYAFPGAVDAGSLRIAAFMDAEDYDSLEGYNIIYDFKGNVSVNDFIIEGNAGRTDINAGGAFTVKNNLNVGLFGEWWRELIDEETGNPVICWDENGDKIIKNGEEEKMYIPNYSCLYLNLLKGKACSIKNTNGMYYNDRFFIGFEYDEEGKIVRDDKGNPNMIWTDGPNQIRVTVSEIKSGNRIVSTLATGLKGATLFTTDGLTSADQYVYVIPQVNVNDEEYKQVFRSGKNVKILGEEKLPIHLSVDTYELAKVFYSEIHKEGSGYICLDENDVNDRVHEIGNDKELDLYNEEAVRLAQDELWANELLQFNTDLGDYASFADVKTVIDSINRKDIPYNINIAWDDENDAPYYLDKVVVPAAGKYSQISIMGDFTTATKAITLTGHTKLYGAIGLKSNYDKDGLFTGVSISIGKGNRLDINDGTFAGITGTTGSELAVEHRLKVDGNLKGIDTFYPGERTEVTGAMEFGTIDMTYQYLDVQDPNSQNKVGGYERWFTYDVTKGFTIKTAIKEFKNGSNGEITDMITLEPMVKGKPVIGKEINHVSAGFDCNKNSIITKVYSDFTLDYVQVDRLNEDIFKLRIEKNAVKLVRESGASPVRAIRKVYGKEVDGEWQDNTPASEIPMGKDGNYTFLADAITDIHNYQSDHPDEWDELEDKRQRIEYDIYIQQDMKGNDVVNALTDIPHDVKLISEGYTLTTTGDVGFEGYFEVRNLNIVAGARDLVGNGEDCTLAVDNSSVTAGMAKNIGTIEIRAGEDGIKDIVKLSKKGSTINNVCLKNMWIDRWRGAKSDEACFECPSYSGIPEMRQ